MSSFDAPYWNALQVLAWVYRGDRALVARCGNETNSTSRWFWQEDTVPGEDGGRARVAYETPTGAPTVLTLVLYAAVAGQACTRYAAIEDAEQEILYKLAEGVLSATGIQRGSSTRQEIPALQWCDLSIEYEDKNKNSAVDKVSKRKVMYDSLLFSREAVLKLWPDVLAADQEQAVGGALQPSNGVAQAALPQPAVIKAMALPIEGGAGEAESSAPTNPQNAYEAIAPSDDKQAALPQRRRGPAPGTVDRFAGPDRSLYPELENLMRGPPKITVNAAALKLAQDGKVDGKGTPDSRATRLAKRYRNSLLLDLTRS